MTTNPDCFVAEISYYSGGAGTLYYASRGFSSLPTDTPASTFFDERIVQPTNVIRTMFAAGTTRGRSTVGYGDLVLANGDGALDGLLAYGFDGQNIIIRQGMFGAAYPSGYTTVFAGTMAGIPEVTVTTVTIKVRDNQAALALPFQTTKYAGNNALPAGLEGVATDLLGKPKPVCMGSVLNVSAPCVNTSKLIYQVNDGAVNSVDAVYDSGIALGYQLYLGVNSGGGAGLCLTSPDGATWTTVKSASVANAMSVAFGVGVFVVGLAGGAIYTSADSVTWTGRTSHLSNFVQAMVFGGGLFVAADFGGLLSTSPDGTTWTARTSGFAGTVIQACAYGGGVWVAVGNTGKISSSPDGTTWTSRTSGFGTDYIRAVTYGNSLFVAVGDAGKISTSPDGTTWTARTSGFGGTDSILSVAYGNGIYMVGAALNAASSSNVATSPDGTTWTVVTGPLPEGFETVVYLGGQFIGTNSVAITNGPTLATSPDGLAWTPTSAGDLTTAVITNIAFATSLAASTYANSTDLLDDTLAPQPGTFKYLTASGGSYFRLGSSPAGLITADVTQGANAAARTAAQLFTAVLTRAGKSAGTGSGNWKAADVTALDGLNSAVCGYWTFAETTPADVLDLIANSVGASWYVDRSGLYRIAQLVTPSGTPVMALTANDMSPLTRVTVNDSDEGVPLYCQTLTWGHNYTVQTSGLAGAVGDVRRAFLAVADSAVKSIDASIQTAHLLAVQMDEDSLMQSASDASTEATRRLSLRKVRRDMYEMTIPLDSDSVAVDVASIVSITHSRFGLSGGQSFVVLRVEPDAANRTVKLDVWG